MKFGSVVLLGIAVVAGCTDDETPKTTDTGAVVTSEPDEAAMLTSLSAELGNYTGWDQITGWEGIVASMDGTHGAYVSIWYDATAMGNLAAPVDGATSFKEGYATSDGATIGQIAAMRYEDDYGWFYGMYNALGEVQASGRVQMCIDCHESGSGSPFLAVGG